MESAWLAGQTLYLHQGIFLPLIPHSQFPPSYKPRNSWQSIMGTVAHFHAGLAQDTGVPTLRDYPT